MCMCERYCRSPLARGTNPPEVQTYLILKPEFIPKSDPPETKKKIGSGKKNYILRPDVMVWAKIYSREAWFAIRAKFGQFGMA